MTGSWRVCWQCNALQGHWCCLSVHNEGKKITQDKQFKSFASLLASMLAGRKQVARVSCSQHAGCKWMSASILANIMIMLLMFFSRRMHTLWLSCTYAFRQWTLPSLIAFAAKLRRLTTFQTDWCYEPQKVLLCHPNLDWEDANSNPAIPCKTRLKARLIWVSWPEPESEHSSCMLRFATGMPVDVIETQYLEEQVHPMLYNYDQKHFPAHS